MKYLHFFLSLAIIAAASCNESTRSAEAISSKDTSKPIENKVMIPASSCYSTTAGKDSVFLKVEVFPNVVTGNLSYNLYEKDSNKGEFEGRLHGDTLIADYKFVSEGKQSTRQVIFLIKNEMAVEGYGNMEEKNGEMVFTGMKEISFGKGLVLKKSPCGEH